MNVLCLLPEPSSDGWLCEFCAAVSKVLKLFELCLSFCGRVLADFEYEFEFDRGLDLVMLGGCKFCGGIFFGVCTVRSILVQLRNLVIFGDFQNNFRSKKRNFQTFPIKRT